MVMTREETEKQSRARAAQAQADRERLERQQLAEQQRLQREREEREERENLEALRAREREERSLQELGANATNEQRWEFMMRLMINETQRNHEQTLRRDRVLESVVEQFANVTQNFRPLNQPARQDGDNGVAFQVMPDLTKNIEEFNGEDDAMTAKAWIQNIDSM